MRTLTLNYRQGAPAFFDMAVRFNSNRQSWYCGVFRMGDRAAAYMVVGNWRVKNPDRHLVVVEDSLMNGAQFSRYLPGKWLFKGIADEIWEVERFGEKISCPPGDPVFVQSIWRSWGEFHTSNAFQPDIKPEPEALERASKELKSQIGSDSGFISFQPLFDANYSRSRNGAIPWWYSLCEKIAERVPVVILGDVACSKLMSSPKGAFPLWSLGLNPMESLAVISMAQAHVGGETGTTIWAPIFGVPTLALYHRWGIHNRTTFGVIDVRPNSFGRPVIWGRLGGAVEEIAKTAWDLASGVIRDSTPW